MEASLVIATEFEYRHRGLIIVIIFVIAYACYSLDPLNIVYAIVPKNPNFFSQDALVHLVYAASALLAGVAAAVLTWATAYRFSSPSSDKLQAVVQRSGGPYRYVRNPHYIGYFLLIVALGSFLSRSGFPILIAAETLLFLRLIPQEEKQLERQYGEHFREYSKRVRRLLPSLHPQIVANVESPRWREAFWHHAFQWGLVATLIAFAYTLSDPVGYAFGFGTVSVFGLQIVLRAVLKRYKIRRKLAL